MIVEQFLINKAKEIDNPISNWGIGFTAEVIREWVELQGLVKMNIKKVLQDYISYHWIEEFITDEQKDAMLKNLGVYIKGMIPQLTIHSVVVLKATLCEHPFDRISGYKVDMPYCNKCRTSL